MEILNKAKNSSFGKNIQHPENQKKSVSFIREIALKLSSELDNPNFVKAVQELLTKQIRTLDLASPIGRWVEKTIQIDNAAVQLGWVADVFVILRRMVSHDCLGCVYIVHQF